MPVVPEVPLGWLTELVNEYATETRLAAGEESDRYPDLSNHPGAPRIVTPAEQQLVEVAERLWPVFGAAALRERLEQLNVLLREAALSPKLDDQGAPSWTTRHRSPSALLLAGCTATLLELIRTHGWQRFGTCAADNCQDVYVDLTGRGSRRYCSHSCLNRTRVRAYRSRQIRIDG